MPENHSESWARRLGIAAVFLISAIGARSQSISDNLVNLGNYYEPTTKMYKDVYGYVDSQWREYALLTQVHGLHIVDVTDPGNPRKIVFIDAPESNWKDVKVYKHYAYLGADGVGEGIQIIDLSRLPDTAYVVSVYTENNFGSVHNMWVDTSRALLYTTEANGWNCRVLSLEDPENPRQISYIEYENHDMVTRGNIMVMMEARHNSFSFYDMSDSTRPVHLVRATIPDVGLAHNSWFTEDGNHLITTQEEAGIPVKMWDVSDYSNIHIVDEYLAGEGPESIGHNAYIKGDRAYLSHYGQGFRVLDVSDPENMREIGHFWPEYPEAPDLFFGNWGAYVFLPSGNILTSHVRLGLFVLRLEEDVAAKYSLFERGEQSPMFRGQGMVLLPDRPFGIRLVALNGRVVHEMRVGRWGSTILEMPGLTPGVYALELFQGNIKQTATIKWP